MASSTLICDSQPWKDLKVINQDPAFHKYAAFVMAECLSNIWLQIFATRPMLRILRKHICVS